MACCGRRKPLNESDGDPMLDAQGNEDNSYTHTDELTNPDTSGMSSLPAAKHKKGFIEESSEAVSAWSLTTWWSRSKPGPGQPFNSTGGSRQAPRHVPPKIEVGTPRSAGQAKASGGGQGWGWPKKNEDNGISGSAAPQGTGTWKTWANVLPLNVWTEQKPPPAAAAPGDNPANVSNGAKRVLHTPPDKEQDAGRSANSNRPNSQWSRPLTSPQKSPVSTRRSVALSPGDQVQGGGKGVKSKISDKELQEVTSRIGELKRNGKIDNAFEGLLYHKVSARDPHLFMAWTVYQAVGLTSAWGCWQCNGDEGKFLTALRGLR